MTDPTDSPAPRWSVEQRLNFVARRLFWDGAINREDLISRFGVSANQATADLARLREAHPGALSYDTVAKTYRAHPDFTPAEANPSDLLREFRLIAEGHMAPSDSTLKFPPPLALAELPERAVEPAVLRSVIHAIRANQAISARYVSFQRPGASRRTLSPHALVFDGFRWHIRAHDVGDDRFKDFVIARLSDVKVDGEQRAGSDDDAAWNHKIIMEIAPHPGLDRHQRAVIARDYGMKRQRLQVEVREAMLFYAKRRFGLEEGHRERLPRDQHIVLVAEIDASARP